MPKYSSKVLDLAHLTAAPITALVEADAMGIQTFYEFLEKVAFEPSSKEDSGDPNGNSLGKLRYVHFTYDRIDKGKRVPTQIKVPLLSLLPLPAMEVENAKLVFAADIVDTIEEAPPLMDVRSKTMPVMSGAQGRPRRVLATFAPTEGNDSSPAIKMDISIYSSDMPAGLAAILNIMSNAVSSNQGTFGVTPPNCEIGYTEGKHEAATVSAFSTDEKNLPVNDDITFRFENPNPQGKIRGKNLDLTVTEGNLSKVQTELEGTIIVTPTAGKATIRVSLAGQPPKGFESAEACDLRVSQGEEPDLKVGTVAIKILPKTN